MVVKVVVKVVRVVCGQTEMEIRCQIEKGREENTQMAREVMVMRMSNEQDDLELKADRRLLLCANQSSQTESFEKCQCLGVL